MARLSILDWVLLGLTMAAYGSAALWSIIAPSDPFPLPGFRRLAADPPTSWGLLMLVIWAAVVLCIAKWRTRDRLVFASGALGAVGIIGALYGFRSGAGGAIGLLMLSTLLYQKRDAV